MRYSLLLHYREPTAGEIDPEAMEAAMRAFQAYADALNSAGVLIAAEVLQPLALAILLAFILEPLIGWFIRRRVPRIPAILDRATGGSPRPRDRPTHVLR